MFISVRKPEVMLLNINSTNTRWSKSPVAITFQMEQLNTSSFVYFDVGTHYKNEREIISLPDNNSSYNKLCGKITEQRIYYWITDWILWY